MKLAAVVLVLGGCAKEPPPLDIAKVCAEADAFLERREEDLVLANPDGLVPEARCRGFDSIGARVISHANGMRSLLEAVPPSDVRTRASEIVSQVGDAAMAWFGTRSSVCPDLERSDARFAQVKAAFATSRQRIQTLCSGQK